MRFIKDGEWNVTTPLYIGSKEDIEKARLCAHPSWKEGTKSFELGNFMVIERCGSCVATRARWRPATPEEIANP